MTGQPRLFSPNIVLSLDGEPVILGTAIPTRGIYRTWLRQRVAVRSRANER